MPLRGKVPSAVEKRLKMMLFGTAGSGKTFNSLMFPSPYLIDTEHGAENDDYTKLLEANGGAIFQSSDFEEVYKEVQSLSRESHPYKTLIIDPITVIYNKLVEDFANDKKVGEGFGRHFAAAGKRMNSFINLLLRLDMNIIITAHSKNEYGENLIVVDKTFDGWKKLDYLFDLVIELAVTKKDRMAIVRKSRMQSFAIGEAFPFSYDEIKRRYKGKSLESKADVSLEIGARTADEIIGDLIKAHEEGRLIEPDHQKIIKRFDVSALIELQSADIDDLNKCWDWIKSRLLEEMPY